MATLPGNSTIDSTNDNNGLNTARRFNPQSGTHGSIAACTANLRTSDNLKAILGHGDKGIVVTGTGQSASDPMKYISLWNQSNWEASLKTMKNCTTLYFYACHPGASQTGADFLYNVARVINARSFGPTGFLYINNNNGIFTLEPGSTWQTATPTIKPSPIEPPTPYFMDFEPTQQITLRTEAGFQNFTASSVSKIALRLHDAGPRPLITTDRAQSAEMSGRDALTLINFIAFDRPFSPPGSPLAIITAEINITFEDGTTRRFSVLNNRIVHDLAYEEVYYYCKPGFEELIR